MFNFKKKAEKVKQVMVYSFIPFALTKENCERAKIAKDKHKMWLANANMEIQQTRAYLNDCKKRELAMPTKQN